MKKTALCVLMLYAMLSMAADAGAQNFLQRAIVKTRGKQSLTGEITPGRKISGAFVKIRDGNVQQSGVNGQLSFPVSGGRYYIESVKYEDYQLVDSDELGKEQVFSEEPKSIVIASIWEMNEDRYNEEKRMREQAEMRYRNTLSEIRRMKEELKISSDSAQVLIGRLNASREKEEALIKDFAERYSKIDFDRIDDFNNEWALYILTGQLNKADSLLNTRGNIATLEDEYAAMRKEVECGRSAIRHQKNLLRRNEETQAGNERNLLDKRTELADNYYKRYEVAVLRYEYDDASAYLAKRADLDTANAEWQFDAAHYLQRQNQFNDSEKYYKRALNVYRRFAKDNQQVSEPNMAVSLNNLALLYSDTRRYEESETMCNEALGIWYRLAKVNSHAYEPYVAMALNNMARLYSKTLRSKESEAMYREALEIRRRLAKENPQAYEPDLSTTLNNLANLYSNTERFEESERMYMEALDIYRRLAQENPQGHESHLAITLNNLARLYFNTQRHAESEKLFGEALEILSRIAAENPQAYEPYLEMTLNNLLRLYLISGKYNKSYETYEKLLPIVKKHYNDSPEQYKETYAIALGNQSFQCMFMREFAKAEQYAREGLSVNPAQVLIYSNLASSLLLQGKYAEAEQIYRQYKEELKASFLDDFKKFEEAGIIPDKYKADVERIKLLLDE